MDLDPLIDPCVPFMCTSRDFRQGMGGGIVSVIFCLQTVRAKVWHDRSKLFETLTVFLITLSRNKGADKTSGAQARAQAGLGICCSDVPKVNFS